MPHLLISKLTKYHVISLSTMLKYRLNRIVTVKMFIIHFQTDCAKIEKTAELTLILIYARFDNRV